MGRPAVDRPESPLGGGRQLNSRRHAQGAVVMSLDTYNSLMETVHLLRSPATTPTSSMPAAEQLAWTPAA